MRLSTLAVVSLFALVAGCGPAATTTPATDSQTSTPTAATPTAAPPVASETGEGAEEAQEQVARLAPPYNQASYEAGRRAFAQCRACHTIEVGGPNRVGPNLHGVFGREIGTAAGFDYSDAVDAAAFTWDAGQLDHWLSNPQTFLPGNRMAFAGVRNPTQRRDLIAYLMVEAAPRDDD